jgi:glucose-1-phosphate thymidylyltransferase
VIKKAIVLAAGRGTRLLPLTLAMPKEMIRVGVKPVIEHVITVLKAGKVKEVLVIVGRKKESIMDYLGSGERFGIHIYYRVQDEPRGTAHAVYHGKDFIGSEDFIVMYGDNYLKPYDVMNEVIKFHKDSRADVTLVLHPVSDPRRYGIVKINEKNEVLNIIEKPSLREAELYKTKGVYLNIAGALILKSKVFDYIENTKSGKESEVWLTDTIDLMKKSGCKIYGYIFNGKRYDVGTFQSLQEADRLEQSKE